MLTPIFFIIKGENMAEPRGYSILRVPKPSLYLHYWIDNAPNKVVNNAIGVISQYKESILQQQLTNFRQIQNAKLQTLSQGTGEDIDKLAQLFDASVYQENLESYLEANGIDSLSDAPIYKVQDFESAMQTLDNLENIDSIEDRLIQFKEAVEQLLDAFDPIKNPEAVKNMRDRFFREMAHDAEISKAKGVPEKLTTLQKSKCATKIVRDILSKEEGKVFDINKLNKDERTISRVYKRLLILAEALDNFEFGSIKSAAVRHGSKTAKISNTAKDDNEVLMELATKVQGMGRYLKYNAGETAAAVGVLKPSIEVFKSLINGKFSQPMEIGDKYFHIKKDVRGNEVYQKMVQSAESKISTLTKQKAKADVRYTVGANGVFAYVGFSVKTGKSFEPGFDGTHASIKLQDETSLMRLLAREAGLSDIQLYSILQLLVAHSGSGLDSMLDNEWNRTKEKILYMSALDAISGGTEKGFADFLITPTGVVSIATILEEMIQQESILSLSIQNMNTTKGSLNRQDYVKLNIWNGISTPQDQEAIERSNELWSSASEMLYQTKIRIMLNISDLARFKSL